MKEYGIIYNTKLITFLTTIVLSSSLNLLYITEFTEYMHVTNNKNKISSTRSPESYIHMKQLRKKNTQPKKPNNLFWNKKRYFPKFNILK